MMPVEPAGRVEFTSSRSRLRSCHVQGDDSAGPVPQTGALTQIGDSFYGATDLAVTGSGEVYVTELYNGNVSKLSGGGPVPIASLDEPVAIEYARGALYVSAGVFSGPGQVVTITP